MKQGDVRMRGFVERVHIDQALATLRPLVRPLGTETVSLDDALERTLAEDVASPVDVPGFAKSAVDGYGIHAEEAFGASDTNPLAFALVGEVLPGSPRRSAVAPGEAVRIMTGGPVPDGVDAVVMAEHAEERGGRVFLTGSLPPGKNVVPVGEDIRRGAIVLGAGTLLGPYQLGVLASVGRHQLVVRCRPAVAVATTGNELVTPEDLPSAPPTAVVTSNTYVVEGLVRRFGGAPARLGIVRDDPAALRRLLRDFPGDILITTGGTSVGKEDYLPVVVTELGKLHVHGLNMRPGSPVGFGEVGGRLVFLLPGNPVAAAVGFDVVVRPCLQWMLGQVEGRRNARRRGRLLRKVPSALNRIDFVRVTLVGDGGVEPVRAGAGVLTSLTASDGFLIVPKDREGYDCGEEVEVYLHQ